MTDLQAAAERAIRQWDEHDVHRQTDSERELFGEPLVVQFAREIVRLHAAALLAGEDEPVTEEWLSSVGFKPCVIIKALTIRINNGWELLYWLHDGLFTIGEPDPTEGIYCRHLKTRGDVIRLCQALGIELKGQV